MLVKLRDLADLQIGYQHRDVAHPIGATNDGSHRIIQIKDLDLGGKFAAEVLSRDGILPYIWSRDLFRVTPAGEAQRYLVRHGDVLFLSRGQRAFAVAVVEQLENAIASYYFYILHPQAERVMPEYLAWYINQPSAQAYLESHQLGSHIKMIPKLAFEELEIALPPLATQRAIVELEKLRQREEHTMARLAKARKKLVNNLALQAALGGAAIQAGENNG